MSSSRVIKFSEFFAAAANNDLETVKSYLATYGNDPAEVNRVSIGGTALNRAARAGHIEVVKALLDAPAIKLNAHGGDNEAPLFEAAKAGHTEIVLLILDSPKYNPLASACYEENTSGTIYHSGTGCMGRYHYSCSDSSCSSSESRENQFPLLRLILFSASSFDYSVIFTGLNLIYGHVSVKMLPLLPIIRDHCEAKLAVELESANSDKIEAWFNAMSHNLPFMPWQRAMNYLLQNQLAMKPFAQKISTISAHFPLSLSSIDKRRNFLENFIFNTLKTENITPEQLKEIHAYFNDQQQHKGIKNLFTTEGWFSLYTDPWTKLKQKVQTLYEDRLATIQEQQAAIEPTQSPVGAGEEKSAADKADNQQASINMKK